MTLRPLIYDNIVTVHQATQLFSKRTAHGLSFIIVHRRHRFAKRTEHGAHKAANQYSTNNTSRSRHGHRASKHVRLRPQSSLRYLGNRLSASGRRRPAAPPLRAGRPVPVYQAGNYHRTSRFTWNRGWCTCTGRGWKCTGGRWTCTGL